MKGYKALDKDMRAIRGNGMQYEIGKSYFVHEEVIPCKNGFHFCKSIEELNAYYEIANSRIFEIEAFGKIVEHSGKYAAEEIKLVRELSKEEIKLYFIQNQNKFIENEDYRLRRIIAQQGCCLDKLVKDKNSAVRCAVAEQGFGLDALIHDADVCVRMAVAEQGYAFEVLVRDESWYVRRRVAEQGYGLDILVYDKDSDVRLAVAMQGYGLDILVDDGDLYVSKIANRMLDERDISSDVQ